MKFGFILSAATLLNVLSVSAAVPLYINSSEIISPPATKPVIDATAIANLDYFDVSDLSLTPLPYETIRTFYFTNEAAGSIWGHPGYFFEYTSGSTHTRMSSWHNRGTVSSFLGPRSPFSSFTAANWLLVSSDNIVNSGSLNVTDQGLLRLDGNTINLQRGRLRAGAPFQSFESGFGAAYLFDTNYFNDLGVTDLYWAAGSNNVVSGNGPLMQLTSPSVPNFSVTNLHSPVHQMIQFLGSSFFVTNQTTIPSSFSFFGSKGVLTSSYVTSVNATQILVQTVFVTTNFFDTNLNADILFYPDPSGLGAIAQVGFHSVDRDLALDLDITNSLYVIDGLALRTNATLIRNAQNGNLRRPDTYAVSTASLAPFTFIQGQPGNANLTNFPIYSPSYASNAVAPTYAAYAAQLSAQRVTGTDPTNFPGRVEIWGQDVNLRDSRIRAESTVILNANNLVSNSQARVSAPFLCFDVGTTQPQLLVSNLAPSTVNRLSGTVAAWSGVWENSDTANPGVTIRFHVLIVDHNLQTTQPVTVSKFSGRAPQIVLHDFLSVNQRLRLDSSSLYVKTNGGLSFPASWSWGASNMVNILNYTNDGFVTVPGTAVLGTDRGYPYNYVINRGTQIAQSQSIYANTFENYGTMQTRGSVFSLTATDAALRGRPFTRQVQVTTNFFFIPPTNFVATFTTNIVYPGAASVIAKGDININASTLVLSNALLQAGDGIQGSIVINASTRLTDAGPGKTNYWIASGGIRVPQRPTQYSDLMGTYIVIKETNSNEVVISWDGKNISSTVMGYSNNLAVGKLTLDGASETLFRFVGIPAKDNAIYVDYLELLNGATNFADPSVFSFEPNFKIYFAHANIAASRLNGAQNNHIRWVPSFTGPLSTTNIVYPSGIAYPVNISLAQYPDFDSDGDGIPNHKDSTPIYTADSVNLSVSRAPTNRVLLSWQALANATSYVEYKPSLTAGAWQILRSTTAPSSMRVSVTDAPLTGRTQRIYRVRVDLPPQ